MTYQEKDFSSLMGMQGFSDKLLETHFKLYAGYVKNTNTLMEMLKTAEVGTPGYAELKRRFGWEFNGMRLHEFYFANMKKSAEPMGDSSSFAQKITEDFQSLEAWKADFVGTSTMRGIGWTILYYDPAVKQLFNIWINEHDVGHLAGGVPLLVFDVFEHAYVMDYGINRAEYVDAFFNVIDWQEVEGRFDEAKSCGCKNC